MKRKQILKTAAILVFAGLTAFAPASAQHRNEMPADVGRHGMMIGRMAKELNLTDDQKNKMKEIWASMRETSRAAREEIRKNRETLRQMIQDGTYNEGRANELLTRNAELQRQLQLAALNRMNEARQLLTAEQQEKLDRLLEARKERIQKKANERRKTMKERKKPKGQNPSPQEDNN